LVGLGAADDAAVYRLDEVRALIVTTDFFTPIVDDPYDYGAIAAANSLSDVYAMGGEPFLALNIAALPPQLPPEFLAEILRGGAEKAREAGVVIAGGHTVQDKEPKFGLVAVGLVHPEHLLTKGGLCPGDALVLTKPLGTGIITTAFKGDHADPAHLAAAVASMKALNRTAARLAGEFALRAATDITGFGFLGHAWEMVQASGVGMRLRFAAFPFLEGARLYARAWLFPGGSQNNRAFYGPHVSFAPGIAEEEEMLLFDAQTSGGLFLAVPGDRLGRFLSRAAELGQPAWAVGEVTGPGDEIEVL
jgi:selenide,water dikinase